MRKIYIGLAIILLYRIWKGFLLWRSALEQQVTESAAKVALIEGLVEENSLGDPLPGSLIPEVYVNPEHPRPTGGEPSHPTQVPGTNLLPVTLVNGVFTLFTDVPLDEALSILLPSDILELRPLDSDPIIPWRELVAKVKRLGIRWTIAEESEKLRGYLEES